MYGLDKTEGPYMLLAIVDGDVHQLGVLGLLGRGEDEGWVGGGILGLVLVDSREVSGVADNGLSSNVWSASGPPSCVNSLFAELPDISGRRPQVSSRYVPCRSSSAVLETMP